MFRRHFFLVIAVGLILVMAVTAGYKILAPKKQTGPGGPGGPAMAQGRPGGGPGGPGGPGAGGRRGPGGPGGRGAMVRPAVVELRPFTDRLDVLGVAKGRESVTLTSNTTEMVDDVRFRPGQRVSRGQVLVELRRNEEDAAIIQAEAQVNKARQDAQRWNALAERGFAPKATAEQYQVALTTAQANLRAAQARTADRVIRAPFNGTIGLSDIAPGALISPGTVIATLDDTSVIRVDFDVPDRYLSVLREGMPITARNDSYPDQVYKGVVARIDTRIDQRTRALRARAEFQNGDGRIKPGMLMRVSIERGSRQSTAVPEAAVQFTASQPFVYVITPQGQGLVAQQRPVLAGSIEQGFVEIREGLRPGERVVADGLNRIQPGQPVSIGRPGGPGQGGPGQGGPAEKAGGPGRPNNAMMGGARPAGAPQGAPVGRSAGAPG